MLSSNSTDELSILQVCCKFEFDARVLISFGEDGTDEVSISRVNLLVSSSVKLLLPTEGAGDDDLSRFCSEVVSDDESFKRLCRIQFK